MSILSMVLSSDEDDSGRKGSRKRHSFDLLRLRLILADDTNEYGDVDVVVDVVVVVVVDTRNAFVVVVPCRNRPEDINAPTATMIVWSSVILDLSRYSLLLTLFWWL